MSVIINELEVATREPEPPTGSPEAPTRPPRPSALTPMELASLLRHMSDRAQRVRAD